ncbi:hypothetical protein NEOLI_000818 [Neolecta irregularis DAH-3]|uniref:Uncharacterized protein n=1 Tax=Neolecta irregularis (strain DAH-3) TaxID=1198029 RepID=A0A1U7LRR5_NEOID|nr:hypothetical protein NEOLI_000818 [Neolecta irregularis DAH-3]|eukprot:OLL25242.1 hypothetical protein NEOLI_000818 [Neolecta irregularis DAH-3]
MRFVSHFYTSLLIVSCAIVTLWLYFGSSIRSTSWNPRQSTKQSPRFVLPDFEYEHPHYGPISEQEEAALMATPGPGTWTIDYSEYKSFPLTAHQYRETVQKSYELQQKIGGNHMHMNFWKADASFQDIAHNEDPNICESSISYLLGDDVTGLARQLTGLFMSAGLAIATNRTFHIIEKDWAWGQWTDYFQEYKPNCHVPPDELVAYPQHTRHWVITENTWKTVYTHNFRNTYEDLSQKGVLRQKAIFQMVIDGIDLLLHLNNDVEGIYRSEQDGILKQIGSDFLSVQIRSGDSVPRIPSILRPIPAIESYEQQIGSTWSQIFPDIPNPTLAVISDDLDAIKSIRRSNSSFKAVQPFEKTQTDLFPRRSGSGGVFLDKVSEMSMEDRKKLAKKILVRLAIAKEGKAVICRSTSHACRLLASMMGWQRAILDQKWISLEVYSWRVPEFRE